MNKLLLDGASAERNVSLEGAPSEVNGEFDCRYNNLTSLEGGPTIVKGHFNCSINKLTSLKGAPKEVGGYFHANDNNLTSLEGAPVVVGGYFSVSHNQLTSLEGAPTVVGGYFSMNDNKLTSLKDVHKHVKEVRSGSFFCEGNPLESHVLGLMKIKWLLMVWLDNKEVMNILNSLLPGGTVLDAQSALLDAGLDEWAQL